MLLKSSYQYSASRQRRSRNSAAIAGSFKLGIGKLLQQSCWNKTHQTKLSARKVHRLNVLTTRNKGCDDDGQVARFQQTAELAPQLKQEATPLFGADRRNAKDAHDNAQRVFVTCFRFAHHTAPLFDRSQVDLFAFVEKQPLCRRFAVNRIVRYGVRRT